MSYYLLPVPNCPQVWQIEDKLAVRIDVDNPPQFKAGLDETIWDVLRDRCPVWFGPDGTSLFQKVAMGPGEFHPRIWRPVWRPAATGHPFNAPGRSLSAQQEGNTIAVKRGQLTALARQLDRICQTGQPEGQNLDAYGHDIRNLLILACTEAEDHWRGVLVANGITHKRLSTKDYVKLREPTKLDQYAVTFPSYPWLEAFKPYEQWSNNEPTQSLKWYDAYNAVKHDREMQFGQAAVRHVFDAISACAIMMVSQFGLHEGMGESSELRSFFYFSQMPEWPISECYLYSYGKPLTPVRFDFKITES
jgi:hypothetical protein